MRRIGHVRSPVKCHVRIVRDGTPEADEVERDYQIPTKGFCHECEASVDEEAGKLHRATCKVDVARKRTA